MGHGGQLICSACRYSLDVMFGVGFIQCGAFDVPMAKDGGAFTHKLRACIPNRTEYNLVRNLLIQKHGTRVAYGYGLYRCTKCGKFHNRFHYQIKHDDGLYEPEYMCKKCAVRLDYLGDEAETEDEHSQIEFSNYPCPKCGKHTLLMLGGFLWD